MTAVPIILDLSRTLSRAGQGVPTGIDRVELAYARHLLAAMPERLHFAAINRLGHIAGIAREAARRLIAQTAAAWRSAADPGPQRGLALRIEAGLLAGGEELPAPAVYLLVSHHHLNKPGAIAAFLRRRQARLVCLVHDLIPLEFPEYARPGEAAKHRLRMATVARLAEGVIANSQATLAAFRPLPLALGRRPAMIAAPLGIDPPEPAPAGDGAPAFVCLGTIEPRKNHLLLLTIWRRLAQAPAPPRLALIGRRGWENENIVDMLERCAAIRPLVSEHANLSDAAVAGFLARAPALLLPSFAEGFGLPVAEALARGVPVLASDLPALREVGGDVPEYLDPLDGAGWLAAIEAYAAAGSPRRAAQMARLAGWQAPHWDAHMAAGMSLVAAVAAEGYHHG